MDDLAEDQSAVAQHLQMEYSEHDQLRQKHPEKELMILM